MKDRNALIGYTGFVGSNISSQKEFEYKYNSKNIRTMCNNSFELVICAGVSAKKWWANENPTEDKANILSLIECLKTIKCNKFILISSIDVYKYPFDVDENIKINIDELDAYGKNRYYLEEFIRNTFDDSLIIRLPAIYGNGLKKNFIYDLLNPIPQIIKAPKYEELKTLLESKDLELINLVYEIDDSKNYNFNGCDENKKNTLLEVFEKVNFTSKSFTDYRSVFQFYNLNNLVNDIDVAIKNNIQLLNISSEPTYAYEVAQKCFDIDFKNEIKDKTPLQYNFKSIHSELFGGKNGYLYDKEKVLKEIKDFATKEKKL